MKTELPEGNNTETKSADFSHGFEVQFMSPACFKVSAHWSMQSYPSELSVTVAHETSRPVTMFR